jgi:hypothetical protein
LNHFKVKQNIKFASFGQSMAQVVDLLSRIESVLRQTDVHIVNNSVTEDVRNGVAECLVNLDRVKHLFSEETFESIATPLRQLSSTMQRIETLPVEESAKYEAERIKTGRIMVVYLHVTRSLK